MSDEPTLQQCFQAKPPIPEEMLVRVIAEYRANRERFLTTGKAKPKTKADKVDISSLDLEL